MNCFCGITSSVDIILHMDNLLSGLGVALGNTLFQVIVNQYFLKYRATASGIALSGACLGSFVLPVVLEYMLTNIGLSGTFLITGGFIMHVLPAAILMKEPPWIKRIPSGKGKENKKVMPPKAPSVLPPVQKLDKIEENSDDVSVIYIKKVPSSGTIFDDEKNENIIEEDNLYPTTRSARVFSRNGIDNLAFSGSKSDLREKNENLEVWVF